MDRICIDHCVNILNNINVSPPKDTYRTISKVNEGIYKEKGSKFTCHLFPLEDEYDVEIHLNTVKSMHPKARHHCYAFRMGLEGKHFRFNDDGEPSGTAGKPILGQLRSFEVTNVLAVVVRYFGGTKLGVSGLINAYRESTRAALENSELVSKKLRQKYAVQCNYEDIPMMMEAIKNAGIDIVKKEFLKEPELILAIPLSEARHKWNIAATQFIGHSATIVDLKKYGIEIKELDIV